HPLSALVPYPTLFRSVVNCPARTLELDRPRKPARLHSALGSVSRLKKHDDPPVEKVAAGRRSSRSEAGLSYLVGFTAKGPNSREDRKSTRLNSSHGSI